MQNVTASLLDKAEHFPADWTGIEIRQYCADHFKTHVVMPMHAKKLRRYRNDVITRPL
jgi:hypothetical protein